MRARPCCSSLDIDEAIIMASRVVVFSAAPGRIKAEVPTDLPHPRHYTIKTSPEFEALRACLLAS